MINPWPKKEKNRSDERLRWLIANYRQI